jgi:hypothetical protein
VTERELALAERALEVLDDGDQAIAYDLLLLLIEDGEVVEDRRCRLCRLWPGEWYRCGSSRCGKQLLAPEQVVDGAVAEAA